MPLIRGTKQDASKRLMPKKEDQKSKYPVPVADPGMFTGLLGEIAEEASQGIEADKVGIYGCLLAEAGMLAGRKPHVMIGDRRHPLLIWPLLMGRTGSGRKGDAMASATRPMGMAFLELDGLTVTGLSTGEGLIWHIRDPDDKGGGTDDKRLLIYEEELGHIIAVSGKEGSTLSGVLRKAWDGGRLQSLTKNNPYIASWSHTAVIAAITPAEFRARVSNRDLSSGLWNRYLPLFVERRQLIANPEGMSEALLAEFGEDISKAVNLVASRGSIGLSRQASELLEDELYPEFADLADEEGRVADFMERSASYLRRISALTSALTGRREVPPADLESAACLVRYSIASARYALDPGKRDPRLDRLRRAVDEAYPAGLSGEQVRDIFNRHLTKAELLRLVKRLCEEDEYEKSKVPTGGRPREELRRVEPLPWSPE
jgi:hypothetical protein